MKTQRQLFNAIGYNSLLLNTNFAIHTISGMGKTMKHISRWAGQTGLLLILTAITLVACTSNQFEKKRGEALKQYETIIRWSQWDAAADFIDAKYQMENPISRLEMDRLRLFRVTAYNIRSTAVLDEGKTMKQVVEIKLYNTKQGVERAILDNQVWRYNEDIERWQLHSGLPDPTQRY
jgi:hypothetical protein